MLFLVWRSRLSITKPKRDQSGHDQDQDNGKMVRSQYLVSELIGQALFAVQTMRSRDVGGSDENNQA